MLLHMAFPLVMYSMEWNASYSQWCGAQGARAKKGPVFNMILCLNAANGEVLSLVWL